MKRIIAFILFAATLLSLTACSIYDIVEVETEAKPTVDKETTTKATTTKKTTTTKPKTTKKEAATEIPISYEYDNLQKAFLQITPNTSIEEIESLIVEYGFCYTRKEYKGSGSVTYKLAYAEGVARQSHADSGDHIEVSFDKETGTLKTAQYVNLESRGSALLYCSGIWFDFSNSMEGDYSGYYYINSLAKEDGITIKYSNDRERKTKYFSYPSAEKLIQHIIDSEKD